MDRNIITSSGAAHVDAYLEYRMIVGNRDGGHLLPEHEYEKLRKEFYENREKNNFHSVDYSWLEGAPRPRPRSEKNKQLKSQSSMRLYCTDITPLGLLNKEPFSSLPEPTPTTKRGTSRMLSTSSASNRNQNTTSNRPSRTAEHCPQPLSRTQPTPELSEVEKLTQMLSDASLSAAKKYGIKKELQMIKAREIQQKRKLE